MLSVVVIPTGVFLELNDINVNTTSNDSVYDLVIAIAAGGTGLEDIASSLRHLTQPHNR